MEQMQERIHNSASSPSTALGSPQRKLTHSASHSTFGNPDLVEENIHQLEERFASEFGSCTAKLEEIKQNMKNDGTQQQHQADSEEAAERRRAERERAERERRLREQAKEARSPKKKVALQIESRREFPLESLPEIPMMVSSIHGVKGTENIAMVNIPALKALCYPLNDGQTVESLLDLKDARDKAAKYEKELTSTTDYVTMNMKTDAVSCRKEMTTKCIKAAQQLESQQLAAKYRKADLYSKKMRHLLESCRSSSLNNSLYDINGDSVRGGASPHGTGGAAPIGRLSSGSLFQMTPAALWLTNLCAAVVLGRLTAKYRWRKNIPDPQQERSPEEVAKAMLRRKLAMEKWSWVWRILKIWMPAHRAKRRVQAIKIVKTFCRQMSEAARIKVGVMRFTKNVRNLQRACREFLNNKHKRTGEMNKLWCHVEDEYLSEYFRIFAAKIMVEEAKRREAEAERKGYNTKSKAKTRGLKPGEMAGTDREVNWKQFRVPVAARKKAISRLYMDRLRDYVRNCAGWYQMAKKTMMAQAEFARFLRSLGARETVSYDELNDAIPPPSAPNRTFWEMTEDEMLALINKTARNLKHLDQMANHPAVREGNHDINSFTRRQSDRTSQLLGTTMHRSAAYGMARGFLGRHRQTQLERSQHVNLHDLLTEFNPAFNDMPDMTEEEASQTLGGPRKPSIHIPSM